MDCIVHGVAKNWTQLSDFHFHCSLEPEHRNDYDDGSQVVLMVKDPPANAGDMRHRFNPWVRKIPWRKANPLQYSCLENPMDRGGWQARVHRAAKSRI